MFMDAADLRRALRSRRPGDAADDGRADRARTQGRPEAGDSERREQAAIPGGQNSHTREAWAYVEWTWEGFGSDDRLTSAY